MKNKDLKSRRQELCIIGGGNMGEAILSGLLKKKIFPPSRISVVEISGERQAQLSKKYNILVSGDLITAKESRRIFLCIKPQDMASLLEKLQKIITEDQVLFSVMAGKSTKDIESGLLCAPPIVRVMPNTPALVQRGVSGVCFNEKAGEGVKKDALRILKSIGTVQIFEESMMNAVTAVSGSGPAYVFYFIESFLNGAAALGFSQEDAARLVIETMRGSLQLLKKTGLKPEELRKKVTSRGGTTEAALNILVQKGFSEALTEAVQAAKKRGDELSKN